MTITKNKQRRNDKLELLNIEDFNCKSPLVYGVGKNIVLLRIWIDLSWCFIKKYKNPIKLLGMIRVLKTKIEEITDNRSVLKLANVDGKYFFTPVGVLGGQGWPSRHYYRNFLMLAREYMTNDVPPSEGIALAFIAITKKCPLKCEHCYEWDELNKKETLRLDDLKAIVKKFQDAGVSQIVFGGGEPLSRMKDLVELLKSAEKKTDFWVSTSGFNLTKKNAITLKKEGLTGINISLDNHDKDAHNKFRGSKDSFDWVLNAAKHSNENNLITSFDLCPVRNYCTEENLMAYAELAKKLGGAFIQIYEPKAVGHFAGKDVLLEIEHKLVLERFQMKLNHDPAYIDYPIVAYADRIFRKTGCTGSGDRFLYVDTDGRINPCPFCKSKSFHFLDGDFDETIKNLRGVGCNSYLAANNR